jgi:homoserine kinase
MADSDKLPYRGRKITLRLPGSTSNLGPGLDCLGLALNIYSNMSFFVLDHNDPGIPLITFKGSIAKSSLAQDQGKLTYTVLSRLWAEDHDLLQRVRIIVDSEIPLGVGLGSSSTAILGALWAASVLKDRIPSAPSLLAEAALLEGHPENLAACLLGNLVVASPHKDGRRIVTQRLNWPKEWHLLVVSPQYTLTTQKARAVLPAQVKLEDAIHNVQKVALLVAAVARSDESAFKDALEDRLHEPYRAPLVPELVKLRREMMNEPVLGCTLSGAGSSMIVILNQKHKPQVLERLKYWVETEAKPPRILDCQVDDQGIQELIM